MCVIKNCLSIKLTFIVFLLLFKPAAVGRKRWAGLFDGCSICVREEIVKEPTMKYIWMFLKILYSTSQYMYLIMIASLWSLIFLPEAEQLRVHVGVHHSRHRPPACNCGSSLRDIINNIPVTKKIIIIDIFVITIFSISSSFPPSLLSSSPSSLPSQLSPSSSS